MTRDVVVLLYWGRRGGGSIFTLDLLDHLAATAPAVDLVVSVREDNADLWQFRRRDATVLTIASPLREAGPRPLRLLRQFFLHRAALRKLAPSVIVVTMNSPLSAPFLPFLKSLGARFIYVAHDAAPHPGDFMPRVQVMTQSLYLRAADHVVALSSAIAARMQQRRLTNLSCIPLQAVMPAVTPRRSGHGDHPVALLFAGRMVEYKGIDLLRQALLPLRSDARWRLTVAGEGPLSAQVRAAFEGWPQVHQELGWLDESRFETLFAAHDLLLCPYTEASQSGILARALAAGLPAAVTPCGALAEQIGADSPWAPAGLVAADTTPEAFREVIGTVLHSPTVLRALSNAASDVDRQKGDRRWAALVSRAVSTAGSHAAVRLGRDRLRPPPSRSTPPTR